MINTLLPTVALFARAMRDDVRSRYPVIIRVVAISFLVFAIMSAEFDGDGSAAAGLELLTMITMINFFGLTMYALGSFASAITEEKEEETLALMRMTRLGPLSILLGKGGARLAGGMLFLSVQIPFTMLCIALGGVSAAQIFKIYAILASYIVFMANLGLLCSVVARRTSKAVLLTVIVAVLLYVLPFFVWFSGFPWTGGVSVATPFEALAGALLGINPLAELIGVLYSRMRLPIWAESIGFHLVGGVVCFALARLLFEKFCGAETMAAPQSARAARKKAVRRSRAWNLALGWKDFHFLTGGRRGLLIRFCLYSLIVVGIIAWMNSRGRTLDMLESADAVRGIALLMFSVELAIGVSRVFGAERKAKTLGSIFILPMSTARLVWQKMIGISLGLFSSAGVWLAGYLAMKAALSDAAVYDMWAERLPPVEFRGSGLLARLGLTPADIFTIAQYALFAALIAYFTLRMRRGALLTGVLAIFVANILVQIIYSKMYTRVWAGSYSAPEFVAFQQSFYFTAATVTMVFAGLLFAAIPRRLAECAAEE